jgi:hypothetical protein
MKLIPLLALAASAALGGCGTPAMFMQGPGQSGLPSFYQPGGAARGAMPAQGYPATHAASGMEQPAGALAPQERQPFRALRS